MTTSTSTRTTGGLAAARRATRQAADAMARRDDAIRRACADGSSIRQVAGATGLSTARVHQILHEEPRP